MAEFASISGLTLTSAPATEPITLTEAKLFLRVDTTDEDALITGLISAARERAQRYTERQFVTASYTYTAKANQLLWVSGGYCNTKPELLLPLPPVQTVSTVTLTDANGTATVLSASGYRVVIDRTPGKIVFLEPPNIDMERDDAIRVAFTCGYGAASAVPLGIKTAMYWMINSMYMNREDADSPVTSSVERLLDIYRAYRVGV